jgi:hypothetical protein
VGDSPQSYEPSFNHAWSESDEQQHEPEERTAATVRSSRDRRAFVSIPAVLDRPVAFDLRPPLLDRFDVARYSTSPEPVGFRSSRRIVRTVVAPRETMVRNAP